MKYLLTFTICLAFSLVHAQSYKVQQCVIEGGLLKTVTSDYDPSTGKYSIEVNGVRKPLDQVYPAKSSQYAASASWYINSEQIIVSGKKYVKYGLPRVLGVNEIEKAAEYKQVGVYIERGTRGIGEIIYLPAQRGCEFQPYQQVQPEPVQKKIYYDADWKVTSQAKAAFYRLVKLTASGKPVGIVRDYYINGTKQWQGSLSVLDMRDNNNDVMEGVCAWYYRNGTKSEEAYYVNGRHHGLYKSWAEDGSLVQEIEYKYGVIDGYVKTYSDDGQLLSTEYYKNGEPARK